MSDGTDQQRRHTAEVVMYWMRRRGMTRQVFAGRLGKSLSWMDKIRNGDRQLDRLSVLQEIADVLEVPLRVLIDRKQSVRNAECVDVAEVAAIRRGLQRYDVITKVFQSDLSGRPDPDLAKLRQRVAYAWSAFQTSSYSTLGPLLGELLVDAQYANAELDGDDRRVATELLAQTYQIVTSTLRKLGYHQLEWLAAERGVIVAEQTEDAVIIGGAAFRLMNALRATDGADAAVTAALTGANRLQPVLDVTQPSRLSLYGTLLLQGAVAAAMKRDPSAARDLLDEAEHVGNRLGADRNDYWTCFGPTNVRIHRVSALVELRDWASALAAADAMESYSLSLLARERRANHLIDVARAYGLGGQNDAAAHALLKADDLAPKEVRCRPLARDLIHDLWRHSRRTPSGELRQLAERIGIAA